MTVYRNNRRLTIEAENAGSPEEALQHVTDEAASVLGNATLVRCEITAAEFTGNAWNVEATFKQEGSR